VWRPSARTCFVHVQTCATWTRACTCGCCTNCRPWARASAGARTPLHCCPCSVPHSPTRTSSCARPYVCHGENERERERERDAAYRLALLCGPHGCGVGSQAHDAVVALAREVRGSEPALDAWLAALGAWGRTPAERRVLATVTVAVYAHAAPATQTRLAQYASGALSLCVCVCVCVCCVPSGPALRVSCDGPGSCWMRSRTATPTCAQRPSAPSLFVRHPTHTHTHTHTHAHTHHQLKHSTEWMQDDDTTRASAILTVRPGATRSWRTCCPWRRYRHWPHRCLVP
jgi:hypothetical protein